MLPDDRRHGTYAGANQHWMDGETPCQPCREASNAYRRNRRARIYLARGPLEVPSLGTIRRIRALVAIGHTMRDMDAAMGYDFGYVSQLKRYAMVHRSTALKVAALYERWCMTPRFGPLAERNKRFAKKRGWAPPLAWDDIDHDLEPNGLRGVEKPMRLRSSVRYDDVRACYRCGNDRLTNSARDGGYCNDCRPLVRTA